MIKRFSSHFIFPVCRPPVYCGIIETDQSGTITAVAQQEGGIREMAHMEFHSGILCPGFIDVLTLFTPSRICELFPTLGAFMELAPSDKRGAAAVLQWMQAIRAAGAPLTLSRIITIFTRDAALAAAMPHAGTLEVGKTPGIFLISHIDFENMSLTEKSTVKKLI